MRPFKSRAHLQLLDKTRFSGKRANSALRVLLALGGLLLALSACGRPTDLFDPIIIGEATAPPTMQETPAATPTARPVPSTPIATVPAAPTITLPAPPVTTTRTVLIPLLTTGPGPAVTPLVVPTATPTVTATMLFYTYLAQVISQLQQTPVPTVTPTATPIPAPIVLTRTPVPPTATATGLPTNTPTPFSGSIRLLERDPRYGNDFVPMIAYAVNESRIDKSWSSFYQTQPRSSELVRLYTSESARFYDPLLALTSTQHWAEGVCMVPSTMVGVQFWGDENDGWARVLVDGSERWRGNTYGRAPNLFVRFLEIRDLPPAPHVVRIEPLGQVGTSLPGGNIHVSIYAIACGLPVASEIFLPILPR
jgi:hypothetical protein